MKEKISEKKWFSIVVIIGILLIPFLYAFFYLKAYWDPYGHMSDIPVAIVNNDEGDEGKTLVTSLKDKDVLDLHEVSSSKAKDGLKNKKYYATITIPKDFTKDLNSAKENKKVKAEIVYSPNQKSNYLASQIIDRVVVEVEKQVRSEVSDEVVKTLSGKIDDAIDQVSQIDEGVDALQAGSSELTDGAKSLSDGTITLKNGVNSLKSGTSQLTSGSNSLLLGANTLSSKYALFNEGVKEVNNGANKLSDGLSQAGNIDLNAIKSDVDDQVSGALTSAQESATHAIDQTIDDLGIDNKVGTLRAGTGAVKELATTINGLSKSNPAAVTTKIGDIKGLYCNPENPANYNANLCAQLGELATKASKLGVSVSDDNTLLDVLASATSTLDTQVNEQTSGLTSDNLKDTVNSQVSAVIDGVSSNVSTMVNGMFDKVGSLFGQLQTAIDGAKSLSDGTSQLVSNSETVKQGIDSIASGANQLNNGIVSADNGASELVNGANSLSDGANTLSNGMNTLNSGINTLGTKVGDGLLSSKEEITKLNGLDKFTANPVKTVEKDVNKVSTYGSAFAPFFLSIGLWVGALIAFVMLYNDPEKRFKLFSIDTDNKLVRTLCYMGLSALQGIVLGILLLIFLDLDITSYPLYFGALILVALMFESIIEFLIVNFGDVGKFISMIILVLQLAAAGGTFPIQTVDKGFQKFSNYLPMKYSIDLFREVVVSIDGNLLRQALGVIIGITVVFTIFNVVRDLVKKSVD